MSLSLKTKIFSSLEEAGSTGLLLEALATSDSPLLLFVKGMGVERIDFFTKDSEIVDRWLERLAGYEFLFLEDPDNFKASELQWNELDPNSNEELIVCHIKEAHPQFDQLRAHPSVPPMMAPLGIPEESRLKFLQEIEIQSPDETLSRFTSILQEFRTSVKSIDPLVWAVLVGDVIAITLHSKLLDKAVQIADEHRLGLAPLWNNSDRVIQIFSSYDPKGSEISLWAKIFATLPTPQLINTLETHLGSEGEPQILKLMNYRALHSPEELVEICFGSKPLIQKILLQWLTPHWKPFHYGRLLNSLDQALRSSADEDLVRLWISALVRASKSNAFDDLAKIFRPKFFRIWGTKTDIASKRMILNAISESPSTECREFLRKIRKYVQGELADHVEKMLLAYRQVKS